MKPALIEFELKSLPDNSLDLLLDEAERALLEVEARTDEPGSRSKLDDRDRQVAELKLVMAELADSFPDIHYDLEWIGDRLRNHGSYAGITALRGRVHVMDFVRLSLEVFFLRNPTFSDYASSLDTDRFDPDPSTSPLELYDAYEHLLDVLRERLS